MKILKIITKQKTSLPMTDKELSKLIRISENSLPNEKGYQLRQSQGVVANYLKHNGLSLDIFDARKKLGEYDSSSIANNLADKIALKIKNNLNGKTRETILFDNENESFLRQLYRTVENLANKVSK
ncbi:MAG: hypothetical protein ACLSWI_05340 [Candidatus Gastranaerophilaceae bacterium]